MKQTKIFPVNEFINNDFVFNLDRNLKSWQPASPDDPVNCQISYSSVCAIKREQKRQRHYSHVWITHPFSDIRFLWEIFMTLVYAISFVTIPFMTSFIVFDYDTIRLDKINLILYIIFFFDIIYNIANPISTGIISFKKNKIFGYYLWRGFLIVDILTSLPYDHITYSWRKVPGPDSSLAIALINLTPMLKIVRYPTFHVYLSQLFTIKDFTYRVTNIIILSLYVVFWSACFCYLIPIIVAYAHQDYVKNCSCWLTKVTDNGIKGRFEHALFIVLQNFVASGYGGIKPESTGHTIISTGLMFLGRMFEGYIIS